MASGLTLVSRDDSPLRRLFFDHCLVELLIPFLAPDLRLCAVALTSSQPVTLLHEAFPRTC